MTKTKRTFEAETVTMSTLRLESTAKRAQMPVGNKRKSRSQVSPFITVELIHKIIEQVKGI